MNANTYWIKFIFGLFWFLLDLYFPFSVKFPPVPAKAQVNSSAKVMKQLGKCTKHIKNINSVWVLWFNMLWMPPCRFSRPGRVAAVSSSTGDFPPAGRHTQHPLQKQSCGDFPHQHRCKWTCLLIATAWKKKKNRQNLTSGATWLYERGRQ